MHYYVCLVTCIHTCTHPREQLEMTCTHPREQLEMTCTHPREQLEMTCTHPREQLEMTCTHPREQLEMKSLGDSNSGKTGSKDDAIVRIAQLEDQLEHSQEQRRCLEQQIAQLEQKMSAQRGGGDGGGEGGGEGGREGGGDGGGEGERVQQEELRKKERDISELKEKLLVAQVSRHTNSLVFQ